MSTIPEMRRINGYRLLALWSAVIMMAGVFSLPLAITRWSTLQLAPNADMLPGGKFVADADMVIDADTFSFSDAVYVQRIHMGFSEWVGMDVGYADGFVLGMKARVVKEDVGLWYAPSLVIGFQNLYTSREAYYFGAGNAYPKNEFYAVAAKSSDWAMVRIHAGFLSAASGGGDSDKFNPFIGIEKYFGHGLYITAEAQRRSSDLLLSVFAIYRPITELLEVNVGIIDAPGLAGRDIPKPFRPMLRAGIKVLLGSGFNGLDGLTGVEDRIDRQRELIREMDRRIDSIAVETRWSADRIHELSDFPADSRREERKRVIDELTRLRNLYDQEPFDPELIKSMTEQIGDRYDFYSPHLRVIITDPEADPRVRRLAVSLIGEMDDKAAANILISILNRFEEPSLKIETMVALGKLREARSRESIARLRNDPDSGVSFTAREVYRQIFGDEEAVEIEGQPTTPFIIEDTVPERRLGR